MAIKGKVVIKRLLKQGTPHRAEKDIVEYLKPVFEDCCG